MEKEEKKDYYETKINHLTLFRVVLVFICEFICEFSFGIMFSYYYNLFPHCTLLKTKQYNYIIIVSFTYRVEFGLATICFLIGLASLLCCNTLLTKIYVSFNNLFKSIIVIVSIVLLVLVFLQYWENGLKTNGECGNLKLWVIIWMSYQLFLLGVAVIAIIIIGTFSLYLYCKDYDKEEIIDIQNYLKDKINVSVSS